MFHGAIRSVFILTRLQIPAEFVNEANAVYDQFELEGHTNRVRQMALDLLNRMPTPEVVPKKRSTKRELSVPASPSPSLDVTPATIVRVTEAEYDSVMTFHGTVKDLDVPKDLRTAIRKSVQDWIR